MQYCLLDLACLVPTEDTDADRVRELERRILREQRWREPIGVHSGELFVMDGHHRLTVARRLGLARIPAVLLDYENVRVRAWREGETIMPDDVVAMARSGGRFPPKTTRHIFDPPLPLCDVPLSDLRSFRHNYVSSGTGAFVTST
ncbi:ParB N-terminal domain-containing protein [Methylobacterium indicum]|uniref:ParB N-terminal domain-containing protein n=1 Tax=Methylobacterium indicum TaxID=1775910 RepID=UPI001A931A77